MRWRTCTFITHSPFSVLLSHYLNNQKISVVTMKAYTIRKGPTKRMLLQYSMLHATKSHKSVLHCSTRLTTCSIKSIQFLFHVVIFSWDMGEEALIGFKVPEVLEVKTRRQEKGLCNNLVKELRLEDTKGYNEMMRMKYSSFQFLPANIEKDVTPIELAKGGIKTNDSSFIYRSRLRISYIVEEVCERLSQIWPANT